MILKCLSAETRTHISDSNHVCDALGDEYGGEEYPRNGGRQ